MRKARFFPKLYAWLSFLLLTAITSANPLQAAGNTSFPEPTSTLIPVMKSVAELKDYQIQFMLAKDDLGKAVADIRYVIANPSNETITLPVTFPYTNFEAIKDFQIIEDGKPITLKQFTPITDQDKYQANLKKYEADKWLLVDPVTANVEERQATLQANGKVMVLPLQIGPNQQKTLHVQFVQQAGIDQLNYDRNVMMYQYLLLPASAWRHLESMQIRIITPKEIAFATNLPLKKKPLAGTADAQLPQQVQDDHDAWDVWELKFAGVPSMNLAFSAMEQGREESAFSWGVYAFLVVVGLVGVGVIMFVRRGKK